MGSERRSGGNANAPANRKKKIPRDIVKDVSWKNISKKRIVQGDSS